MRMISMLAALAFGLPSFAEMTGFDDMPAGPAPRGWTATQTGEGNPKWTVEKDDSAPSKPNVLKQSGVASFPICLKNDTSLKDGFVEVKFKLISGEDDQVAGLIWRAKDEKNYYVARANALENNMTIYHVVNGRRSEKKRVKLTISANPPNPPKEWQSLRVDFAGEKFTVSLNGEKTLEWEDPDKTFTEAGKLGLWTKADSVTLFDDFTYGGK